MITTRLLMFGLCAILLGSASVAGWSPALHSVRRQESASQERASFAASLNHPQTRRKRPAKRRAPLPVVQEIDAEGLRKILQRDTNAPRPLLVNFWATWCTPCREEFPDLVQIAKDYKERNLEFVIISLDDPAELKTGVPRFLQRMRAQMPAFLLNADDSNAAISAVDPEWAGGMPATFLFDTGGQVVYKHLGPIKPEVLRAELEKVMSNE